MTLNDWMQFCIPRADLNALFSLGLASALLEASHFVSKCLENNEMTEKV